MASGYAVSHSASCPDRRFLTRHLTPLLLIVACTTSDLDTDGYTDIEHNGDDRDDRNAAVSPAASCSSPIRFHPPEPSRP